MSEIPAQSEDQVLAEQARICVNSLVGQDETSVPENLHQISMLKHDDETYIPFYYRPSYVGEGGEVTTDIIVVEIQDGQEITGFGGISFVEGDETPSVKNKPYVAYTETAEGVRGKGANVRRLIVMNEIARAEFGYPLHSDPSGDTTPEAHRSWEVLVAQDLAEQFFEGSMLRFRFK